MVYRCQFWPQSTPAPFLSFKGITHTYLLKISITRNKNLIPLLNFLINCISAKSAPQILSLNDEYSFLFFKFSSNWFI